MPEKISQMPPAALGTGLTGAELVPLIQAGGNVQTPISNLGLPIVTPYSFGAVNNKAVDSTAALQAYFTYIAQNPLAVPVCAGSFGVSSPLLFDTGSNANYLNTSRVSYWNSIFWDISANGLAQLITFQNCIMHRFVGQLVGYGVGFSNWTTRKTQDIFVFGQYMSYSNFDKIEVNYAQRWGLNVQNLNTEMHIQYLHPSFCGSANGGGGYSDFITTTATAITNNGSATNIAQTSSLTLSTPLPSYMTASAAGLGTSGAYLLVNDTDVLGNQRWRFHTIESVVDSTHITVYPWFNTGADVGRTCYIIYGGGAVFNGSDTSVCDVSYLDCYGCGIGLWNQSLYPPRIGSYTSQANGVAVMLGQARNAAMESGCINQLYAEGNGLDVVQLTEAGLITYSIGSYTGQDAPTGTVDYKFWVLTAGDGTGNYLLAPRANFILGTQYGKTGKIVPVGGNVFEDQPATLTPHADNTMPVLVKHRDTASITLASNYNRAKLTGKTGYVLVAEGSGANGQPTGSWTFSPSDVTWSINGGSAGANFVMSGFVRATPIVVYANYTTKNWEVFKLVDDEYVGTLIGVNPGTVANGAQFSATFAVAGAALGDIFVGAGASISLAGLNLWAFVSSAGNVTYVYSNNSGAGITLGSHNATLLFRRP